MQKNIIDALGGPAKFAKLIGIYANKGSLQRVFNWKKRGIPAQVLLDHQKVLASALKRQERN